jgi:hypothetical protein
VILAGTLKASRKSRTFKVSQPPYPQLCDLTVAMDLPYLDAMTNIDEQDWRKLCELAANETDPLRLRSLLEQLSKALESRTKNLGSDPHNPKDPSKSSTASARSKVVVMKVN